MNAIAWVANVDHDDELHLRRWLFAGAVVATAHAGLIASYLLLAPEPEPAGSASPPLLIDLAPEAAAPETEADLAPGPETLESQAEPEPEVVPQIEEQPIVELPPTPVPEPEIVIPPKKEVVETKEEPKPKPPLPAEKPVKQQVRSAAQPKSSPKVQRRARQAVAPNPGILGSSTALPSYRSLISAHLQRFKRPASGSGTAVVSFTVDRNGRVVARSLARSSGSPSLDAEAMALIARAQPMPPFPPALPQSRLAFTQAIRFN